MACLASCFVAGQVRSKISFAARPSPRSIASSSPRTRRRQRVIRPSSPRLGSPSTRRSSSFSRIRSNEVSAPARPAAGGLGRDDAPSPRLRVGGVDGDGTVRRKLNQFRGVAAATPPLQNVLKRSCAARQSRHGPSSGALRGLCTVRRRRTRSRRRRGTRRAVRFARPPRG
jgi:hypothetical protein